jgi:hypothetical protein
VSDKIVVLAEFDTPIEARLALSHLEAHSIRGFVAGDEVKPADLIGGQRHGFTIQLHVLESQAERAAEILCSLPKLRLQKGWESQAEALGGSWVCHLCDALVEDEQATTCPECGEPRGTHRADADVEGQSCKRDTDPECPTRGCDEGQGPRHVTSDTCASCGGPARSEVAVGEPEGLSAPPEQARELSDLDPLGSPANGQVPDGQSRWPKKAFEVGCFVGVAFWFTVGAYFLVVSVIGLFRGNPGWSGELSSCFLALLAGILFGPLFGAGCACLAILLECALKVGWGRFRLEPQDSDLEESNRLSGIDSSDDMAEDCSMGQSQE